MAIENYDTVLTPILIPCPTDYVNHLQIFRLWRRPPNSGLLGNSTLFAKIILNISAAVG